VYILDSDVLTIVSGRRRNDKVMKWYDGIDETQIYLSVIAIMEQSRNATTLARSRNDAAGKVENALSALKTAFINRILALDAVAAEDWGRMLGTKNKNVNDAVVAAIAKRHNFVVATGNVKHYVGRGAMVVNPFETPPQVVRL
jgi:predicted nucleic acid-binding protein